MSHTERNRFQDFFEDGKYTILKNHLYNYLLRKQAIEKVMRNENKDLVLEVGSGISPVLTSYDHIVYSDISLDAVKILRQTHSKGYCVVADGMHLPFKADVFSHVISSEVIEHLADDRQALREIARVLKPLGNLIITFPHRRFYFTADDRFVRHFRRYELSEMVQRLREAGLHAISNQKILGPLEKVTMLVTVSCFSLLQKVQSKKIKQARLNTSRSLFMFSLAFKWINRIYAAIAWIDVKIMPRALSTVLMIKAAKK